MSQKHLTEAKEILNRYWGFQEFRPQQERIIQNVLDGMPVIGLLPTGGGKSLCYQVPALLMEGLTLVVSPLISLMEDQVVNLKRIGIPAECIHSGLSQKHADRVLDNCLYGKVKLLFVSPERLTSPEFIGRISLCKIDLIAIDEAHCISQWGHDFRPAYLRIQEFLTLYPHSRKLLLTASATPLVIDEILNLLDIPQAPMIKDSFLRKNINVNIRRSEDKLTELMEICRSTKSCKTIIYCRSRRNVEMIAEMLSNRNLNSRHYHAGMTYTEKKKVHEGFSKGEIDFIVATNAFGMGIDISDIRSVIHYGVPPSIEEYYQEYGRAGRDNKSSSAVMLYSPTDLSYLMSSFEDAYPDFSLITKVYKHLFIFLQIQLYEGMGFSYLYNLIQYAHSLKIKPKLLHNIIEVFDSLGLVSLIEERSSKDLVKLIANPRDLREAKIGDERRSVIEFLMRHYERIWDEYIEIDLSSMEKILNLEGIYDILKSLSNSGYIRYYHHDDGLRLHILQNRMATKDFERLETHYKKIKKSRQDRIKGITHLINSKTCRNREILKYFGEEMNEGCGHCDNCQPSQSIDLDKIVLLSSSELELLIQRAKRMNDSVTLSVLQKLHSEGLISIPTSCLREI